MPAKIDKILKAAKLHADSVITPNIREWNDAGKWPRKASSQAAKSGLLGLYCPAEFGGQALPVADGVRVYEELGKGDGAYAFTLSMHNICAFAVCAYAGVAFKNQWARELTSGRKLANFSLTEPQSGSDAAKMLTKAKVDKAGNFVISGKKAWVSLAGEADVYLTVVKTSDEPGHKDMAMVAIPKDSKGLTFGPLYDTPSYRFLPLAEMHLEKVKVPAENVILPIGKGLSGALTAIDIARMSIASGCCGLIETALDTALRYSQGRRMFGGCALDRDGIRWMLADVATDLEICRMLYRKAADSFGTEICSYHAAQAKLYAPDAALRAANACTQVLGGMGLLQPYGLDRLSRLAQMLKIVDGTTEIQRVVIGRHLAKRAASLPPINIPKGYGEQ